MTPEDAARGSQIDESGRKATPEGTPATGELELTDDDLAETAILMDEEGRKMIRMASSALFELEGRLIGRGATRFEGEKYAGKLRSTGYDYNIDDRDRLRKRLAPLLSQADQDRAFPLPPPPARGVDHRVLNDLHKLGGEIAAIIDMERTSVARRQKLELTEVAREEGDE